MGGGANHLDVGGACDDVNVCKTLQSEQELTLVSYIHY